jgi:hypothetical protein
MRIAYKMSKYLKGINYFEDLGVDERKIINGILQKLNSIVGTGLWLRTRIKGQLQFFY